MNTPRLSHPRVLACLLWMGTALAGRCVEQSPTFATDILPLLEQSCLPCHNATRSEGGLVLESPAAMLEGGDSGPAIKPGNPDASLLLRTAARREKPFMPPDANKARAPRLTESQIETLRVWVQNGAPGAPRPKHPVAWKAMPPVAAVSALAVSPEGRLAAAARGSTVTVYDLLLMRPSFEFVAHPDIVSALAFSPDGTKLASASRGEVKVWRPALHPGTPDLAFHPDKAMSTESGRIAEVSDSSVLLREIASGKDVARLGGDLRANEKIAEADLELSGARFEVSFLESEVKTLGERIAKLSKDLDAVEKERSTLLPKRPEQEKTLADCTQKRDALQRERDEAEDVLTAAAKTLADAEKAKADSPAAALAAAEAAHKTAKEKRDARQKLYTEAVKAQSEAASAVSGAITLDRNAKNFAEVLSLTRAENQMQTAALEKARETLALAESARAALLHAKDQTPLPRTEGLAFDAGGIVLWTRHEDHSLRAWRAATGEPLPETPHNMRWEVGLRIGDASRADSPLTHRVNALAFSPDGTRLATGAGEPSRSGELKIWETSGGTLVREIPKAHKDAVLALDFSRDGRLLASGSADRAVRLWETESGRLFRNLEAHAGHVLSVSLRNDMRRVVSTSSDNTLKTWDIQRSDVVATVSSFSKEVGFARYLGRGDEVFAASATPVMRILRDAGTEIRSKSEGLPKFITAGALSRDGKIQLVGDAAGCVRVFNAEGKPLAEWAR